MKVHFKSLQLLLLLWGCLLFSCQKPLSADLPNFVQFVDPLIGTAGHGHVFVGASVPHGMVQLGPNNLSKGWDWCSGYHDSDSTIIGFAHTHLSGTGIGDLGDILFMPISGKVNLEEGHAADLESGYVSTFDKTDQKVVPGYYSVLLKRYNIHAELTATARAGFHKYTFHKDSSASVLINLHESVQSLEARKGTLEAGFKIINDSTIAGYRISDEWATDHRVYFYAVFSQPFSSYRTYRDGIATAARETSGIELKAVLNFENKGTPLLVKTGISYVSEEGAARNLSGEIPHWDFEQVQQNAFAEWNKSLSRIEFYSSNQATTKIFYTALYHASIAPSVFSDVDRRYRGADGKIYTAEGFTPYTVFSLWDTYRAVHPLYTLIDTAVSDYANTLLAINDQQQRMPVWHLVGNETDCMTGVHSIPVVADACLKGFTIDNEKAFEAIKRFENYNYNGLPFVKNLGYIPADKEPWSVAKGLEYAIDDYAVAQLAKKLGKEAEYKKFLARSKNYTHYFDQQTGFMRGKLSDGSWRGNFDPFHSIHLEDDYVEGNAWQYTWLVPHDVEGLISLFGGKAKFVNKLDSLFLVKSDLNEGASADITGMIGQYAHGNEPSHHILYMYPFAGQQWKTAELVREVFDKFYKDSPDGLIGNEDCGQMSAWYIFSSLGFYPLNPVNGVFIFGSPVAEKASITLNNGKVFQVETRLNTPENKYIQSVTLNNQAYTKSYITYQDIMKGGNLVFTMGNKPNHNFGKNASDQPSSRQSLF